jgi:hypothetical protein
MGLVLFIGLGRRGLRAGTLGSGLVDLLGKRVILRFCFTEAAKVKHHCCTFLLWLIALS